MTLVCVRLGPDFDLTHEGFAKSALPGSPPPPCASRLINPRHWYDTPDGRPQIIDRHSDSKCRQNRPSTTSDISGSARECVCLCESVRVAVWLHLHVRLSSTRSKDRPWHLARSVAVEVCPRRRHHHGGKAFLCVCVCVW